MIFFHFHVEFCFILVLKFANRIFTLVSHISRSILLRMSYFRIGNLQPKQVIYLFFEIMTLFFKPSFFFQSVCYLFLGPAIGLAIFFSHSRTPTTLSMSSIETTVSDYKSCAWHKPLTFCKYAITYKDYKEPFILPDLNRSDAH